MTREMRITLSNDIVQADFTTQLDQLKTVGDQHREAWSARDLMPYAGYTDWRNWSKAIDRAIASINASGLSASDHFVGVNKMVALGSGARREVEDVEVSRHGCYVLFQNADGSKPEIAAAQVYFAIQTRRQELADNQPRVDLSRMQILELAMDSERRALAETERAEIAEQKIAQDAPKIEYMDTFVSRDDCRTIAAVAKSMGLGEKEIRDELLSRNWIFSKFIGERFSVKKQCKVEEWEYWPRSGHKEKFRLFAQHNAPRHHNNQLRQTLYVTPYGAQQIAKLFAKIQAA